MSNFCSACGAPLNPDSRFCPNCGSPVTPGAVVQAGPAKVRKVHKNRRRAGFIVLAVLLAILIALLGTGIGLVATAERYYVAEQIVTYNNYFSEGIQEFTTKYNENGDMLLQTSYINGEPVVTEYSYGSNGMIEAMTQRWSDGDTETHHFVSSRRRAVTQDKGEIYSEYVYDYLNRCIERTVYEEEPSVGDDPDLRITTEYHGLSRTIKRNTTVRGDTTSIEEYDKEGRLIRFASLDEDGQITYERTYKYDGRSRGEFDVDIYGAQETNTYSLDEDTGELVLTDSERVVLDRTEGDVLYYTTYDELDEVKATREITCNTDGYPVLLEIFNDKGELSGRAEYSYNEKGYPTQFVIYDGDGDLLQKTSYSYQKRSLKGMFRAVLDKFK